MLRNAWPPVCVDRQQDVSYSLWESQGPIRILLCKDAATAAATAVIWDV